MLSLSADLLLSLLRFSTACRCIRDCELVKISPANFEYICFKYGLVPFVFAVFCSLNSRRLAVHRYPQVTLKFIKTIARRNAAWQGGLHVGRHSEGWGRRAAGRSLTSNLSTIAIVPINSESEKVAKELAVQLKHELRNFGKTLLVSESTIRNLLGMETLENLHSFFYRTRVASWVNQQEEEYRFILLLGDSSGRAWSRVSKTHQRRCHLVLSCVKDACLLFGYDMRS